jgi:hypothetical protein
MSEEDESTTWSPYDSISLDEKIRRTKVFIREFAAYSGPIARDMIKSKQSLLKQLEKEKWRRSHELVGSGPKAE